MFYMFYQNQFKKKKEQNNKGAYVFTQNPKLALYGTFISKAKLNKTHT